MMTISSYGLDSNGIDHPAWSMWTGKVVGCLLPSAACHLMILWGVSELFRPVAQLPDREQHRKN